MRCAPSCWGILDLRPLGTATPPYAPESSRDTTLPPNLCSSTVQANPRPAEDGELAEARLHELNELAEARQLLGVLEPQRLAQVAPALPGVCAHPR